MSTYWCCQVDIALRVMLFNAQALCFLFVRRRGSSDAALRDGACSGASSTTELMHARAADPRCCLLACWMASICLRGFHRTCFID